MLFYMPQRKITVLTLYIDNIKLECVETFNFLGINIDKNMNWNSHINKMSTHISKINGILNRLKCVLPQNILLTMYNSLILPRLYYGILAWGYKLNSLAKLQKRSIRIITCSKFNSHSEPLFKENKVIKIEDIFHLQQLKFYYKLSKNQLPLYFESFLILLNHDLHQHNTRHKIIRSHRAKHEFATRCIRYSLPHILNTTTQEIASKISTHSIDGFGRYVKNVFLNNYKVKCGIQECYICAK